jgi:hypothetical protein
MQNKAIINCIDNALRVWSMSRNNSAELIALASHLRDALRYIRSTPGADREMAYMSTMYEWICDSMVDSNHIVTNAVLKAAKGLDVAIAFDKYLRASMNRYLCEEEEEEEADEADTESIASEPLSQPEDHIIIPEDHSSVTEIPQPANYNGIKGMMEYYSDKIGIVDECDRFYIIIKRLEYILDKEDFLAYDAEFRNNIAVYIEMLMSMCPGNQSIYRQLLVLKVHLKKVLDRLPGNKYYRTIEI